ncbi:glutamate ABC transporter substrate-binding protein [Streptomyces durmitorensis]|uniref:Transporter substrate-binding domain-containing protein n=1 Tax=Streptomyces durmitorensis TaxID=319947 RepID=A0ABY4PR62_9ACTN|nr:transporter substrate-binding domain-containing protein [Streptomyces durmitorensis]UQT56333.1 transporter substrate-binding domain-containing protein [Streptomyces durmitorensis]
MSVRPRGTTALLAFLLACTMAGASSCGEESEPTFLGKSQISVEMHGDLPGVSYEDNYRRSGFDHLLLGQLKDDLKIKTSKPANVSSADRVPDLVNGDTDMVIAAFSITPPRMEQIDFVGPYATTRQGFLVGKEGKDATKREDFKGRTVCTWEGTTSVEALKELKRVGADLITLTDASDCVDQLVAGEAYAVSTDQMILYGFARQHAAEGLRVVPGLTIGAPQHYGIGLAKGHRADCVRLREFVKDYVDSSAWIKDFEASVPNLAAEEPNWISHYKPSAGSIDARSCRDKPST